MKKLDIVQSAVKEFVEQQAQLLRPKGYRRNHYLWGVYAANAIERPQRPKRGPNFVKSRKKNSKRNKK